MSQQNTNPFQQTDSAVAGSGYSDDKIRQSQQQVKEITNIMQQNIEKALQRDVNLTNLESNIQNLQVSSEDFKAVSKKTKKKYLWKNRKWTIVLVLVILIIITLVGLGIGLSFKRNQ